MAQKKKILIAAFSFITLILAACSNDPGDRYVAFAQCLTDKGAVMYGAFWCPHCQNQKDMFGKKSFEKIKYVECDPNGENGDEKACFEKKIESFPTWIFKDGSRITGEQSFEELALRTSCEVPKEEMPEQKK